MRTVIETKRETLNIRIKPEVRDLIDRAAKSRGKNRTDFILDSARLAAEDALLDQVIMSVSLQAVEQLQTRLDMPPNANDRLRKTMLLSLIHICHRDAIRSTQRCICERLKASQSALLPLPGCHAAPQRVRG